MRTIALLAMMGLMAAAEQPKPTPTPSTPARLNTAEITAFSAVETRMKAIREEFDALLKQRDAIQADACRRALDTPACEIRPDGTLAKLEPPKPEVKK